MKNIKVTCVNTISKESKEMLFESMSIKNLTFKEGHEFYLLDKKNNIEWHIGCPLTARLNSELYEFQKGNGVA